MDSKWPTLGQMVKALSTHGQGDHQQMVKRRQTADCQRQTWPFCGQRVAITRICHETRWTWSNGAMLPESQSGLAVSRPAALTAPACQPPPPSPFPRPPGPPPTPPATTHRRPQRSGAAWLRNRMSAGESSPAAGCRCPATPSAAAVPSDPPRGRRRRRRRRRRRHRRAFRCTLGPKCAQVC